MYMVKSKSDVQTFINQMSNNDFIYLCDFINRHFYGDVDKKAKAEKRFIKEVKEAEVSMAQGNYVTSSELHEFLGI